MLELTRKTETELWKIANTSLKGAEDAVLEAAFAFKQIRQRYEAGEFGKGLNWQEYVKKNSPYSWTRMKELLQIANDPDPMQKLENMRSETRLRVKNFRKKGRYVPAQSWEEDGKSIGTWHPDVRANWSCNGLEAPPLEQAPRTLVRRIQDLNHKELTLLVLYLKRSKKWSKIRELLDLPERRLRELVRSF